MTTVTVTAKSLTVLESLELIMLVGGDLGRHHPPGVKLTSVASLSYGGVRCAYDRIMTALHNNEKEAADFKNRIHELVRQKQGTIDEMSLIRTIHENCTFHDLALILTQVLIPGALNSGYK
jgi:hypothetical protein